MDELCGYSYEACRRSITVDTVGGWIEFVDTVSDGSGTPSAPSPSVFGLYAQRLRDNVFHFLVVTLPGLLEVHQASAVEPSSHGASGRDVLLQIYSRVPFEMFKAAIESPIFQIGTCSKLSLSGPAHSVIFRF
jgi:hypothetical protein